MNALEFYRLRNDLTQDEFGKKIGVSKQTVYKWEKRIAPISSKHYQTIKDILHLSESEMLNLISNDEISNDAAAIKFSDLDTGYLAKRYRMLQQRKKQITSDLDRKIIDDELAKLDRVSKHVANAINDPGPVSSGVSSLPSSPNTIRNTPELRECIKDAMLREGVRDASELNRRIGYDSSHSLERLLAGKLNWFPDVLSAVLDELKIKQDDAPISPLERSMLAPEGIYNQGAILVRPVPVVDWANAADYIGSLIAGTSAIDRKWDPESIETIPAPTGCRKDTIALRVHGQSMEPKIQDGDKIYCEPVENLEELPNNKIVVVRFTDSAKEGAGCLFCKRFRRIGGEIFLTSDNPAGRNFNEVPPIDIAWLGRVTGKYDDDF